MKERIKNAQKKSMLRLLFLFLINISYFFIKYCWLIILCCSQPFYRHKLQTICSTLRSYPLRNQIANFRHTIMYKITKGSFKNDVYLKIIFFVPTVFLLSLNFDSIKPDPLPPTIKYHLQTTPKENPQNIWKVCPSHLH